MKNIIKAGIALIINALLCGSIAMGAHPAPTPNIVAVSQKNLKIHKHFNDTAVTPYRIKGNGRVTIPHITLRSINRHTLEAA
ncbi:MAG: hypothetical protein D6816_00515 [Bacteroidetes bacterium]|nr:MAG: hypothetical protein D6816_00515 [Bacteroidota bacterium]